MRSLSLPALALLLAAGLTACADDGADPATDAVAPEPVVEAVLPDTAAAPAAKVNLNTATEADFLALPGVGERMAHEFDEYRPYASIQQFRQEIGKYVDADQVTAYEALVFVPVDMNASDAATVAQLPGVDETEAEALVAGRPYASRAAFLEALAPYASEAERAEAETYLADA